jgi:hypothetical protein
VKCAISTSNFQNHEEGKIFNDASLKRVTTCSGNGVSLRVALTRLGFFVSAEDSLQGVPDIPCRPAVIP